MISAERSDPPPGSGAPHPPDSMPAAARSSARKSATKKVAKASSKPAKIIPISRIEKITDRTVLEEAYRQQAQLCNEWLRRQIIENDRIDILAQEVLGFEIKPMHLAMQQFQFRHKETLQLVFRGAGKTTTCTVAKAIHLIIKDRNVRILIASKTTANAETFLKEIKAHLEGNERLIELFGAFYDANKVAKWDASEIEVTGRTRVVREPSITCVGVESAVVSRHYDVILADDLVDEDNARTAKGREKTKTFFYKTLLPTLEPPDETGEIQHRGELHILGTRYHYEDLYGHLMEGSPDGSGGQFAGCSQIIKALDEKGRSPWPEKYPPAWFLKKKKNSGTIIFNSQYQCDTEAMKGEIFRYDDCQVIDDDDIPWEKLKIFMGVDLAIKESEKADGFAIAVVGITGKLHTEDIFIYVIDWFWGHLRFSKQTTKILDFYGEHDPLAGGVEANAYQDSQLQVLKEKHPTLRLYPVQTVKDKITRAWKLSSFFENKRVFFRRNMGAFIDQLVLFPNKPNDLFDALDIAVKARKKKAKRRSRRTEPGVF